MDSEHPGNFDSEHPGNFDSEHPGNFSGMVRTVQLCIQYRKTKS